MSTIPDDLIQIFGVFVGSPPLTPELALTAVPLRIEMHAAELLGECIGVACSEKQKSRNVLALWFDHSAVTLRRAGR